MVPTVKDHRVFGTSKAGYIPNILKPCDVLCGCPGNDSEKAEDN